MFNPEGVKGRTAQPPHKIFNFMQTKKFRVNANIYDVITNVKIKRLSLTITCRNQNVAMSRGRKKAESVALKWVKDAAQKRYSLTAEQLDLLVEDGLLSAYNSYAIDVDCYELNPSWSHPYVQEVLADCLY